LKQELNKMEATLPEQHRKSFQETKQEILDQIELFFA